ncbi:putative F-box protein At1g58310 [Lotus japonicus]|uniref:putative F-box protein At1g58310 n=1 Tax=Lotus japonicus TaxID=34305 RepID=UPI00258A5D7D|nr:putative F-box protein At1g58310 [Lotus japonicus]
MDDLPDALLCHILSFLLTKKAVATSVLSKRWIHSWRSLTILYFDDQDYFILRGGEDKGHAHFAQSVNAVILSRDDHQPIHKFRLNCFNASSKYLDILNVNAWLNAAVDRHVQTLDISLCCERRTPLISYVIFNSTTLVVLKLQLLNLEPPVSSLDVDLPLLKVLHLQNVVFSKHDCLAMLLSGCPILEDFKARDLCFGTHVTDKEFKTSPK